MVYCIIFFIIVLGILLLNEQQLLEERECEELLIEKLENES